MGCQKTTCSNCQRPFKACQLINGLCSDCYNQSQSNVVNIPSVWTNDIIIPESIVTSTSQTNIFTGLVDQTSNEVTYGDVVKNASAITYTNDVYYS